MRRGAVCAGCGAAQHRLPLPHVPEGGRQPLRGAGHGRRSRELTWTKGEPAFYASSNIAHRGFCRDCGTPLTFADDDRDQIEVTTGSLDDPSAFPMTEHFGIESRVAWVSLNPGLPESRTEDNADYPANAPGFVSHQGRA